MEVSKILEILSKLLVILFYSWVIIAVILISSIFWILAGIMLYLRRKLLNYEYEPEKDNKIIRIDKVESKIPVYEIVYITLSKGQKKKMLITVENKFFTPIKSGELKIGDLF